MSEGATDFIKRHAGKNKGAIITSSGVSLATIALCYQLFATKSSNDSQWRQMDAMRNQIQEQSKALAQVEALLIFLHSGEINLRGIKTTNQPPR